MTVEGSHSEIEGDGRRIKQVFNNLLTNAIKYTPEKGKIEVIITDEPEDVCVSIIDNGIGVAKKDQHRIFEKFYTGSGSSLTRESGRMGLGLAIAKGIIEAHEGRIWVASEIGIGSTFVFTLPNNSKGEHVGSYISPVADRMLGLPDRDHRKQLRKILFLCSSR